MVQTFCASVLQVPISLGAIQKVLDRVAQAIEPHYTAIATQARHALVSYIDETPWWCTHTLHWLWVMASEHVAFYMIHPRRSKEAFAALIDDWTGLLVSDGYGVYQSWVEARQTCQTAYARGLPRRTGGAASAVGMAWPLAAACGRGSGAKRLFEFPIRFCREERTGDATIARRFPGDGPFFHGRAVCRSSHRKRYGPV